MSFAVFAEAHRSACIQQLQSSSIASQPDAIVNAPYAVAHTKADRENDDRLSLEDENILLYSKLAILKVREEFLTQRMQRMDESHASMVNFLELQNAQLYMENSELTARNDELSIISQRESMLRTSLEIQVCKDLAKCASM